MFCANCGEKIDDGVKFCMKCGTAVNSALPQTAPITPTATGKKKGKSKAKYWLIFGGIALIVFLFWLCSVPETAQSNVTEVNLSALVGDIEENQARANQTYANKTLRLTGFAYDINDDYLTLAVSRGEYGYWEEGFITVYFNSSEKNKLISLNNGQRITVRGVYETRLGLPVIARAVIENESQSQTRQPTSSETPNDAKGYFDRGLAYGEKGNYDQAIADFTSAIRIDPNTAEAYFYRGLAYAQKEDYDRAIADFTSAIRIDPNTAEAYFYRGLVYAQKEDYDRAIADYNQAIRLNPNFADAYSDRGLAYSLKGNYDQAIADYTQAIRLNPNDAVAYNNRGWKYAQMGNYDQAIADANASLMIRPNDAHTLHTRGYAYLGKRDYDRAIADFESALRIDPNHAEARRDIEQARRRGR